jgi:oxygen-independent coproporphyrinogen-3 oxidase
LIYARPGQTPAAWASELKEAIALSVEHLSLYQLTIEPETMFERMVVAGKLQPMPDEEARILFDTTRETCEAVGFPAYEISNYARPGAECRHNLLYWRYGEYAGIGPGAHARLVTDQGRLALSNEKHPETWLNAVKASGHGTVEEEYLLASDQANEFLLMGLRLAEGIDPNRFEALAGRSLDSARVSELVEDGFVAVTPAGKFVVTKKGVPVLNAVVARLSI